METFVAILAASELSQCHATGRGLDPLQRAGAALLRRRHPGHRPGQPAQRGQSQRPVRARHQRHGCVRPALIMRPRPGTGSERRTADHQRIYAPLRDHLPLADEAAKHNGRRFQQAELFEQMRWRVASHHFPLQRSRAPVQLSRRAARRPAPLQRALAAAAHQGEARIYYGDRREHHAARSGLPGEEDQRSAVGGGSRA